MTTAGAESNPYRRVISSTECGAWTGASTKRLGDIYGAAADSGLNPLAVGAHAAIHERSAIGWTQVLGGVEGEYPHVWLRDVGGTASDDLWAVGEAGTVLHQSGAGWEMVESGTWHDLNTVWSIATDDLWAVGDRGIALHWNGSSFSSMVVGDVVTLYDVWGGAPDDVWARPGGDLALGRCRLAARHGCPGR